MDGKTGNAITMPLSLPEKQSFSTLEDFEKTRGKIYGKIYGKNRTPLTKYAGLYKIKYNYCIHAIQMHVVLE